VEEEQQQHQAGLLAHGVGIMPASGDDSAGGVFSFFFFF
jgi:hypothetical protein